MANEKLSFDEYVKKQSERTFSRDYLSKDSATKKESYEEKRNRILGITQKKEPTTEKPSVRNLENKLPSQTIRDADPIKGWGMAGLLVKLTGSDEKARKYAEATKTSYKIADLGVTRGRLAYKAMHGRASKEDLEYLNNIEGQVSGMLKDSAEDPYVANAVGTILPFLKESAVKGGRGALLGASIGAGSGAILGNLIPGTQVLPEEALTAPGGAFIGAKIAGTFASLDNMRRIEAGSVYRDLTQQGVDPGVALVAAEGYGILSTGLEAAQLKILTKMLPGTKVVMKDAFNKALNKTVGRRIVSGIATTGIGEASVETTQEFVNNVISEFAKQANDKLKGTKLQKAGTVKGWVDVASTNLKDTFLKTLVGFGAVAIPGVSIKQMVDSQLAIGGTQEVLNKVGPGNKAKAKTPTKKTPQVKKAPKINRPLPTSPDIEDIVVDRELPKKSTLDIGVFDSAGENIDDTIKVTLDRKAADKIGPEVWKEVNDHVVPPKIMAQVVGEAMAKDAKNIKLQTKDLRQPAIQLSDGTIIKGPAVSKWSLSDEQAAPKEVPRSWRAARDTARSNGFETSHSTEGFIAKGKFVEKALAGKKLKIEKRVSKIRGMVSEAITFLEDRPTAKVEEVQSKVGVPKRVAAHAKRAHKDLQTMTGEIDKLKSDAAITKLKSLRKPTQTDRMAVTRVKQKKNNIVRKAVRKIYNTNLGKTIPREDLTSVANKALWEYIRKAPEKEIKEFVNKTNQPKFEGRANKAMQFALLNFVKENVGQGVGMSRSRVVKALKEGSLMTPLSLEEGMVSSITSEGEKSSVQDSETISDDDRVSRRKSSVKDKFISEDNVTEDVKKPGAVKSISVAQYLKEKKAEQEKVGLKPTIVANKVGISGKDLVNRQANIRALKQREREVLASNLKTTPKKSVVIKKLTEDKGSSPEVGEASNVLHRQLSTVIDRLSNIKDHVGNALDIQWQWNKMGAPKTGLAMKNLFSRQDAEVRKTEKDIEAFTKEVEKGFAGTKITDHDLADMVLLAETPSLKKSLDSESYNKLLPGATWLRNYFDSSKEKLKERGIDVDFKKRMLVEIDQNISEADTDTKKAKLEGLKEEIERMEFIHIPLQMWFDQKIKEAKKKIYANESGAAFRAKSKLKLLMDKQRRGSTIYSMVQDQKTIKKADVNPVEIIMSYGLRLGHDFAIADIRDSALKEKLIKIRMTKPSNEWVKLPSRLSALKVSNLPVYKTINDLYKKKNLKAKKEHTRPNVYVYRPALDFIDESLTAKFTNNWFTRSMAVIKMAQFYNPLILPMYDVVQSVMGTYNKVWHYPTALKQTILDVYNKSDNYQKLFERGLASKPFAIPFKTWSRLADIKTSQAKGSSLVKAWAGAYVHELKKQPVRTLLKLPLIASWTGAWKMDEFIRVFTANVFQKSGMSHEEAAQTAAKFHGDYASVPKQTRRGLNLIFFTPTFKIAMFKLYWSMIKSAATAPINAHKGDHTAATFSQGLLGLMAVNVMFDLIMTEVLGFEEDDLFRRYKRSIDTDEGPKEQIITLSNPANLPFKFYHNLADPLRRYAQKENAPLLGEAIYRGFQFELHPTLRIMSQLVSNKKMNGKSIVEKLDSKKTRIKKTVKFLASELYAVSKGVKNTINSENYDSLSAKQAKEAMKNDYGLLARIFVDWMAFTYVRQPQEKTRAAKIRRLTSDYKKLTEEYFKLRGETNEEWDERLNTMIEELLDE